MVAELVEYRPMDGFPMYRFGSDGTAWSKWSGEWKNLSPVWNGRYYIIELSDGKSKVKSTLHSFICRAFHGERPSGMQCRHLNGFARDCRSSNLAWGTVVENAQDRILHGTHIQGESHGQSRLKDWQVIYMRELARLGFLQKDIARAFCVSPNAASVAIRGANWKHIEEAAPVPAATYSRLPKWKNEAMVELLRIGFRGVDIARSFGVHITVISRLKVSHSLQGKSQK